MDDRVKVTLSTTEAYPIISGRDSELPYLLTYKTIARHSSHSSTVTVLTTLPDPSSEGF